MTITTSEELAKSLNNRDSSDPYTKYVVKTAKENGLVIVSAIGDDTITLCGGITDEFYLVKGGDIFIAKEVVAERNYIGSDGIKRVEKSYTEYIPYVKQNEAKTRKKINVFWEEHRLFTWKFLTTIPNHTFDIKCNGKNFCKGMVFSLKDI